MYQPGDDFDTQYDRYLDQCGGKSTASGYLVRHSDDLLYTALALLVTAALLAFYELLVAKLGRPSCYHRRVLCPAVLHDAVVRSVLAHAAQQYRGAYRHELYHGSGHGAGIQCGISLNLGLPSAWWPPDRRPDNH